jgi:hypothetical protein
LAGLTGGPEKAWWTEYDYKRSSKSAILISESHTIMPDHSVHRASDLAGDERVIVERWLGRALSNDETISVNAYRPHAAPDSAKRQCLRRDIVAQAREIGARAEDITDRELEDLVSDAFEDVRGRRG